MFGLGESRSTARKVQCNVDTLIGAKVLLQGELRFSGGLYLEGQLCGRAHAEEGAAAVFTVAVGGRVEGEIRAPVVIVHGEVRGEVHAGERLELGPTARVQGDLHYAVIEMASGASVSGRLVHRSTEPATLPAPSAMLAAPVDGA